MQNHYNLLYREEEREMMPLCLGEGIGVIPWSPLARGRLTRPVGQTTRRSETSPRLFMEQRRKTGSLTLSPPLRQAATCRRPGAMTWLLARPGVTPPILGASTPQHLDDSITALSLTLDEDETQRPDAGCVPLPDR